MKPKDNLISYKKQILLQFNSFMDTFEAIKERRSVKHYDQNHSLTDDEINQLMSLTVLSPTSFNMQNWRFVLVKDPEKKKQIRAASWDQAQVTGCSLLVVLCADLKAWKKTLHNIGEIFQRKHGFSRKCDGSIL